MVPVIADGESCHAARVFARAVRDLEGYCVGSDHYSLYYCKVGHVRGQRGAFGAGGGGGEAVEPGTRETGRVGQGAEDIARVAAGLRVQGCGQMAACCRGACDVVEQEADGIEVVALFGCTCGEGLRPQLAVVGQSLGAVRRPACVPDQHVGGPRWWRWAR